MRHSVSLSHSALSCLFLCLLLPVTREETDLWLVSYPWARVLCSQQGCPGDSLGELGKTPACYGAQLSQLAGVEGKGCRAPQGSISHFLPPNIWSPKSIAILQFGIWALKYL